MHSTNLLTGNRIRLTAVTKDDLATMAKWGQSTVFARLFDSIPAYPKTAKQWEEWLDGVYKSEKDFSFAIRLLDGEEMIGLAELEGVMWNQQTSWLAIAIGDEANWNKGYGREAMELLLRFGFHELNLHRVTLSVFSYNERAVHLYKSLGFVHEGTQRESLYRDGKRYDTLIFGLLRREWEEGRTGGQGEGEIG